MESLLRDWLIDQVKRTERILGVYDSGFEVLKNNEIEEYWDYLNDSYIPVKGL